jgi:hypothetical protein
MLISCLRECAQGRWGLFGQNEPTNPTLPRFWKWPEADALKKIATEIQRLGSELGTSNSLCDRFEDYRALRGSNVPGEPKLAQIFLDEISQSPKP